MDKTGELTSKQIVTIIILIVSFTVILLFFFTLNLKSEINSETCRNSVILRGTALGDSTRLNCKTEDICFSKTKDCDVDLKDMVVIKVENKQEFLDEASDLVYNCYWQMGEGKVNYAPKNFGGDKNYCAICDRIYFDKSLKEEGIINVSNTEWYYFLKGKRTPNGDNNLLFEIYKINSIDSVFSQLKASNKELENLDVGKLDIFTGGKNFVVVTSLTESGWGSALFGVGTGAVIGVIAVVAAPFTAGASLVIGGAAIGAVIGGTAGLVISGPGGDGQFLPPTYYPNEPKVLKDLNCYEFSTLS
ncbi:hypothetical protein AUJ84_00930 [Candidatus Pacearchaeota archaeon CG1_02_32_132]|nr:MAG: hypothetical protein AUJ84_00930 [Candidatus Pacearchaeota archaeon CG1_02_32_132]